MVSVVFTATAVANFQQQWEYVLSNFKPDVIYVHGTANLSGKVLAQAVKISGPEELPADLPLVLLAPTSGLNIQGDEPLSTFKHPEDAIYWFGSDAHHIDSEIFSVREPDHKVYVETDTNDQMYSFATYAVVAWDRRVKGA